MAYKKQTWNDNDVITKAKLDHIEEGIASIELTPGPKGETGAQGPAGPKVLLVKLDHKDQQDLQDLKEKMP